MVTDVLPLFAPKILSQIPIGRLESNVTKSQSYWVNRVYFSLGQSSYLNLSTVIPYVGSHVGTGPVLELEPIFRPVLELGRGRPNTGTVPC